MRRFERPSSAWKAKALTIGRHPQNYFRLYSVVKDRVLKLEGRAGVEPARDKGHNLALHRLASDPTHYLEPHAGIGPAYRRYKGQMIPRSRGSTSWSSRRDSNPRPLPYQGSVPASELPELNIWRARTGSNRHLLAYEASSLPLVIHAHYTLAVPTGLEPAQSPQTTERPAFGLRNRKLLCCSSGRTCYSVVDLVLRKLVRPTSYRFCVP